ncbi:MAG: hypothetical protein GY715_22220 [Planctomycetes bacterium]|nr:hypothetical protein [Planctomycetota bacterium]
MVLGAAVTAACADRRTPDRDVVVGLIAPLAGNPAARDGALMAEEEINAAGCRSRPRAVES